jgi:hypothetical protein
VVATNTLRLSPKGIPAFRQTTVKKPKAKPRGRSPLIARNLLVVLFAALAVLILLLRMLVFVAGHRHHHF